MMAIVSVFALLIFALVFYLTLRTGWGAEMGHGAYVVRGDLESGARAAPAPGRGSFVDPHVADYLRSLLRDRWSELRQRPVQGPCTRDLS